MLVLLMLEDAFWSAIAATGFAILFNVPKRTLWGCALAGATGHVVRTFFIEMFGTPIEIATLFGATGVGFLGAYLATRLRAPSLIFSVTGAIPMVPGLFAYSAMIALIQVTVEDASVSDPALQAAAVDGLRVALILGAIALGITTPRLLFRRVEPVV